METVTLQGLQERRGNNEGRKSIKPQHAFFGVYGGGSRTLLRECSPPVQELRSMRGVLLFVTVLASSVLAGIAWSLVSESALVGVFIGTAWFVLFSALDRCLMSSMDGSSKGQKPKRAALMLGRVAIIVIMAHLNAQFVQLWMFNEEIQAVLKEDKQKKLSAITEVERTAQAKYQEWYNAERSRIDDAWKSVRERQNQLVGEIAGRIGSGKVGEGPAAKAQRDALAREEANLKKEEQSFREAASFGVEAEALKQAKADSNDARERIHNKKKNGLTDRSKALDKVASDSTMVWWIYGLFFLIECLAFLVKMLSGEDEYDFRLTRERQVAADRIHLTDMQDVARMRQAVLDDLHDDRDAQADAAATRQSRADHIKEQLTAKLTEFAASAKHGIEGMKQVTAMKNAKLPAGLVSAMESRLAQQVQGFPDPDDIRAMQGR